MRFATRPGLSRASRISPALFALLRKRLPYRGKERTPDEELLRQRHVHVLREVFPTVEMQGFQFLSMARRVLRPGRVVAALDWCDDLLLSRVPSLQRFCRYAVLTLRR